MEGIPILVTAIQRYSPSESTLTAIHSDLIQVSVGGYSIVQFVSHSFILMCNKLFCLIFMQTCLSLQLCLMAKNLKPALPYLGQEYTSLLTDVS